MNIVAFIFARGGSKGLPKKNVRILNGKPLIAWSIEQALAVPRINRVIVSTDCAEILSVAVKYGAEVPFLRPAELAGDSTPEWHAWQHALNYLREIDGSMPDAMVSVPTTAPLRSVGDIENCIDEYEKGNSDIVITVTESRRSPYFNMVTIHNDNVELTIPPTLKVNRRQDAPKTFDITTVCYVAKPEFVVKHNGIFEGKVKAVEIPPERAIDIDSFLDFQIVEAILKGKS